MNTTALASMSDLPLTLYATGFSLRKRRFLRRFLPECSVRFTRSLEAVPQGASVVTWGAGNHSSAGRMLRVEDGFLRSVGLGAELATPLSWAVDTTGIYYDATRPSDLERLLEHGEICDGTLKRAARLRAAIVSAGLTKYNIGGPAWRRPPARQRVILVPGQVERDDSIRLGAPGIKRNIDLLRAVRESCSDAYVVYKPHPDVTSKLRRAGSDEASASRWCDEIVVEADIGAMLHQVDEVHTLTSLTGFEALLRERRVVTYGQPFYAGWGLTDDRLPIERRTRRLTLEHLVAGALLLYPRYLSRVTGTLVSAETALDELISWRAVVGRRPLKQWLRRPLRAALGWMERRT
jgi:capsular polysaccharide export protein